MPTREPIADTRVRTMTTAGTIHLDKVFYKLDVTHAFKHVLVVSAGNQPGDKLTIADLNGEILADHPDHAPRPLKRHRCPEAEPSRMS